MADLEHEGYITKNTEEHLSGMSTIQQYLHSKFIGEPLVSANEFVNISVRRVSNVIDISHVIGSRTSYDEEHVARTMDITIYSPSLEKAAQLMTGIREMLHVESHHEGEIVDKTYGYAPGWLEMGNSEGEGKFINVKAPE